ncbi:MAG TPA: hypothetical protein VGC33_21620 [Acerihabitans sp.]
MTKIFGLSLLFTALLCTTSFTYAAGCLKGAAVGGVVGHVKHHAVLGAAGGCAVGHHMAAKKAKQQEAEKK